MSVPEPSFPPPPPPMGIPAAPVTVIPSNGYTNGPQDTGGGGRGPLIGGEQAQPSFDEWDDEWDDDDESSNSTVGTSGGQVLLLALGFCVPNRDFDITSEKILYEDECRAERERGRERLSCEGLMRNNQALISYSGLCPHQVSVMGSYLCYRTVVEISF